MENKFKLLVSVPSTSYYVFNVGVKPRISIHSASNHKSTYDMCQVDQANLTRYHQICLSALCTRNLQILALGQSF